MSTRLARGAALHPVVSGEPGISGLDINGHCFQARLVQCPTLDCHLVNVLTSGDGRLLTLDQARDLRDWLSIVLDRVRTEEES